MGGEETRLSLRPCGPRRCESLPATGRAPCAPRTSVLCVLYSGGCDLEGTLFELELWLTLALPCAPPLLSITVPSPPGGGISRMLAQKGGGTRPGPSPTPAAPSRKAILIIDSCVAS